MLQLSFFLSFVRCESQCRSSCSIIPKDLTSEEGLIFWPLMPKLRCSVLLVFNNSLFAQIHSNNQFQVCLYTFFYLFIDYSVRVRSVSSAKWWTELNLTALCKLWINNINRRGPKTGPCGTPYFKYFLLDWHLVTIGNCILSLRYDWNQLLVIPI